MCCKAMVSFCVSAGGGGKLEPHLKVEHDGNQQQHNEHDTETSKQKWLASAALNNQGLRERERRKKKERRKTRAYCIATNRFSLTSPEKLFNMHRLTLTVAEYILQR